MAELVRLLKVDHGMYVVWHDHEPRAVTMLLTQLRRKYTDDDPFCRIVVENPSAFVA